MLGISAGPIVTALLLIDRAYGGLTPPSQEETMARCWPTMLVTEVAAAMVSGLYLVRPRWGRAPAGLVWAWGAAFPFVVTLQPPAQSACASVQFLVISAAYLVPPVVRWRWAAATRRACPSEVSGSRADLTP
jgi:hypothetical protein